MLGWREMWEFSPDGELKFETFLDHFTQETMLAMSILV
jgi:hypothetical protein